MQLIFQKWILVNMTQQFIYNMIPYVKSNSVATYMIPNLLLSSYNLTFVHWSQILIRKPIIKGWHLKMKSKQFYSQ